MKSCSSNAQARFELSVPWGPFQSITHHQHIPGVLGTLQNSLPCCSSDFSLLFILPLLKLQPEHLMLNKLSFFQPFPFNCPLSDLTARRFQCRAHQSRFPLLCSSAQSWEGISWDVKHSLSNLGAIPHLPGSSKHQRGNVGTSTPTRN